MKSQVSPVTECPSHRGRRGLKGTLPQVLGLIGLSCCSEVYSPSVLEPMADPDLASPMTGPDLAPPTTTPDPAGTISVRDCAAKTLIQAINAANDESAHPGADTILLQSGCVYTLTGPDNWWYGPTGLPAITSDITIRPQADGTGVIIERDPAAPKFRLFYVNGAPTTNVLPGEGKLTLKDLTVRNGLARGGNGSPGTGITMSGSGVGSGGGGGLGAGGAIFAQGTVTLDGVTLTSNTAQGGAGSVGTQLGAGGGMGGDGGTISSTKFGTAGGGGMKDNGGNGTTGIAGDGGDGPIPGAGGKGSRTGTAGMGGVAPGTEHGGDGSATTGGIGGGLRGLGGKGGGGPANPGDGGGGGQTASGAGGGSGFGGKGGTGGGTATADPGGGGGFGGGGGGATASVSTAVGGGGGIGGGGGSNRGGGGFGGGGAGGGTSSGGWGGFGGGGGRNGGSIFGGGAGSSSLTASENGGGGGAGLGGAVFLMYGSLTVVNSTLSGNTAQGGNGSGTGANAGVSGLGLGGAVFILNGSAALTHATLSNNTVANGSINGPALGNNGSAVYVLSFGKDAPGIADATATLTLANSILADNLPCGTSADMTLVADQHAGAVSIDAILPTLIESHAELSGAILAGIPIVGDPMLDILKENGGPTSTQTLAPVSLAVDAGDRTTCRQTPVLGKDQRGQRRGTSSCHLGAVEMTALTQPNGCACAMAQECSSNACTSGYCG